jgi:hypothetical protein
MVLKPRAQHHQYINVDTKVSLMFMVGGRFGTMQVKAGAATILSNFVVRPTKHTPIPITPDPNYFMLSAKGGLWLQYERIK